MPSTINSDNGVVSGSSGLKSTADTSGVLALQSNGSTGISLGTDLVTTLTNPLPVGSGGTGATSLSGITAGSATNLAGGVAGAVPYQSGVGATGFSAAGTSGQVLTSAGTSVPTWTSQSSLAVGSATSATTATTATTATNLAGGSNGTIPYQSAGGTTQMLAVGSAGQVLQTNGAGAPTWVTPGGGSWVYLSTVNASGASTVNVVTTFDSTYDMYAIIGTGVYFDTATTMGIRFNLGGTYSTSGYSYASSGVNSNTGNIGDRSTSWNKINMTSIASGYSDYPLSFIAYVSNPWNSGGALKQIWGNVGFSENNGYTCFAQFSGTNWNDFSALTGVRFLAANGSSTITGKFRLYGIKNS